MELLRHLGVWLGAEPSSSVMRFLIIIKAIVVCLLSWTLVITVEATAVIASIEAASLFWLLSETTSLLESSIVVAFLVAIAAHVLLVGHIWLTMSLSKGCIESFLRISVLLDKFLSLLLEVGHSIELVATKAS